MCMIFDYAGKWKYLTEFERSTFLKAASSFEQKIETFCGFLVFTGARISEALTTTPDRIDLGIGATIV